MYKKTFLIILIITILSGFFACTSETLVTETSTLTCTHGEELISGLCIKGGNTFNKKYSLEEVNKDFNEFIEVLADNNPILFSNEAEVDIIIEIQRKKLYDQMTTLELLRVLAPITVAYKCENINVKVGYDLSSYLYDNSVLFPLEVRLIGEEVYVIGNNEYYNVPLGSKILNINGSNIQDILEQLVELIPSDYNNIFKKYAIINVMFNESYFDLIDSAEIFQIDYIAPNTSEIVTKTIEGEIKSNLMVKINLEDSQPFSAIYRDHYAILTLNTFMPSDDYKINDFIQFFSTFFSYVHNHLIPNVIIDLRGNSGGNPNIASELFSYIADYSQPYFEENMAIDYPNLVMNIPLKEPHFNGELVILIDGMVSSTSSQFASLIKSQNIAKFFGSETGGSFSSLENTHEYVLEHTQLVVEITSVLWSVDISNYNLDGSIIPDFRRLLQIEDYLMMNNSDIEYDSVLLSAINYVIRD